MKLIEYLDKKINLYKGVIHRHESIEGLRWVDNSPSTAYKLGRHDALIEIKSALESGEIDK